MYGKVDTGLELELTEKNNFLLYNLIIKIKENSFNILILKFQTVIVISI